MYEKIGRELESRYKKTDFPLNVIVEITNHCNLNCVMCDYAGLAFTRGKEFA